MTDFRTLCAELADCLEKANWPLRHKTLFEICLDSARDALAQPEPQGPTVMEIIALADEVEEEGLGQVDLVRRALTRWGRPAVEPVPVSERPWERKGWCNAHQKCWVWNEGNCRWWEFIDSRMISFSHDNYTHCLPHWALPVPNFDLITQGE